jgi:MFS family permease
MPSIWKYVQLHGGSEYFLALVLLIYSMGEFIGALGTGYLHNLISTKATLILSTSFGVIGSVIYFLSDTIEDHYALWGIFTARLLQGLWTGGHQAVEQAYIAEVVNHTDMLRVLSELGMAAVSGFLSGPILGLLLSLIDFHIGILHIHSDTAPGYVQALATTIVISVTCCYFEEIHHSIRPNINNHASNKDRLPDSIGVSICLFTCFIIFHGFSVQETITTPLVTDSDHKYTENLNWGVSASYALFSASGVMSIVAFSLVHTLGGTIDNRKMLLAALFINAIGWILMIDFKYHTVNPYLLILGYILISVGFPVARNLVYIILTKVLGPKRAGIYMGGMLAVGAIARMIGPFWAVNSMLISIKLCFLSTAVLFLVTMLILILSWDRCKPHSKAPSEVIVVETSPLQSMVDINADSLDLRRRLLDQ